MFCSCRCAGRGSENRTLPDGFGDHRTTNIRTPFESNARRCALWWCGGLLVVCAGSAHRALAGAAGFEPTHVGVKVPCLTAWRRPYERSEVGASQLIVLPIAATFLHEVQGCYRLATPLWCRALRRNDFCVRFVLRFAGVMFRLPKIFATNGN